MALRNDSALFWVLDIRGGKEILVTGETRSLYNDATRYVRLRRKPVPADTQEIVKIVEEQNEAAFSQGDFDEEDVALAADSKVNPRDKQRVRDNKKVAKKKAVKAAKS